MCKRVKTVVKLTSKAVHEPHLEVAVSKRFGCSVNAEVISKSITKTPVHIHTTRCSISTRGHETMAENSRDTPWSDEDVFALITYVPCIATPKSDAFSPPGRPLSSVRGGDELRLEVGALLSCMMTPKISKALSYSHLTSKLHLIPKVFSHREAV